MGLKKWATPAGIAMAGPLMMAIAALSATKSVAQGGPPPLGGPLQGLSQIELNRFNAGRNQFLQNEAPQTGLGPVFNGVACAQCHQAGGPGGASPNLGVSIVHRISAIVNGQYTDLENVGGSLIQNRSLREILPNYPVFPEVIPPQAQFVAQRITTPVHGNGLMEAIPAATILARSGINQGNGVQGVANMVVNPDTGITEVGRFGWKAQVSSVHAFSGDALRNEMGVTNPSFPTEVLPQGQNLPPGSDLVADPEDGGQKVNAIADFMTLSAPPQPMPDTAGSIAGRLVFDQIGCAACHVPSMTTGPSPVAALAFRTVNLYSDLLLHDMGPGLADGIRQGQATASQFRTAPLWGLRFRPFLLHDGRAQTPEAAIRQHGGEASFSRKSFLSLDKQRSRNLLEFLSRL